MSDKPLVFISCGQHSDDEKALGHEVANLVTSLTGAEGYFAQNQQSLENLSKHVFGALDRASAFIAIMHHRGEVIGQPGKPNHIRGSVWIEQEIAIASFLQSKRGDAVFPVAAYVQNGIRREGLQNFLIFNPIPFATSAEVVDDLKTKLVGWTLKAPIPDGPKVDIKIDTIRTHTSSELHQHELKVVIANVGKMPITDWIARLEMPSRFVAPKVRIRTELRDKETREYRVFQDKNLEGPLLRGDERRILSIPYEVTTDIHFRHQADFDRLVKVFVYVGDKLAGEASRPFRELQNF